MKTKICILMIGATVLAARADYTPTNAVKGSALSAATTPLSGAETVYLIQSGATKMATVNSLNQAPAAIGNNAQAYAIAVSNIVAAVSNSVWTVATNFLAVSNNFALQSNAVASTLNMRGSLYPSNAILVANILDAGTAARSNAAAFYLAGNPAGYQTASQVAAAVAAGITSVGGGIQPNTVATLTGVITPALDLGGNFICANGANLDIPVDLSAASVQTIELVPQGTAANFRFNYINAANGQNVYMLAWATNGTAFRCSAGNTLDAYAGVSTTNIQVASSDHTKEKILLNWQVIGTQVIYTESPHP